MFQLSEKANEQEVIEFLKHVLTSNPTLFADQRDDYGCFMRALRRGEPTFTVVAQDMTAVPTVCEWLRFNAHISDEKRAVALKAIEDLRAWPHKKNAD